MESIRILENEHENILTMIGIIREMCKRALKGEDFDTDDLRSVFDFIKYYADGHHHSKEEKVLFEYMTTNLGKAANSLVNFGMLVEHDLARFYNGSLLDAVKRYDEEKNYDNLLDIITYAMAYSDLLKRHIEKENNAVYPFAERALSEELKKEIEIKSKDLEIENKDISDKYLLILKNLKEKYS
ncbi:MAG: hemerythrin domain-containing protein [Tissierellia bacterium]|nr:hemerythrin domain-containing protein [Tissierellia bacterium]